MSSITSVDSNSYASFSLPIVNNNFKPIPFPQTKSSSDLSLVFRAIIQLKSWENSLDALLPDFLIQTKIDSLVQTIEETFKPLGKFNEWLASNGEGNWAEKLAVFLCKLPLKAARNIILTLYTVVKGIIYTATHPLKAPLKVAQLLCLLVDQLLKPQCWSKLGIGMLGRTLGQGLALGTALSPLSLLIGGALFIAGLTTDVISTALENEGLLTEELGKLFLIQGEQFSEAFATALLMGLLMSALQRTNRSEKVNFSIGSAEEAEKFAKEFIEKYNLPACTKVKYIAGEVQLEWWGPEFRHLESARPDLLSWFNPRHETELPTNLFFRIGKERSTILLKIHGYEFEGYDYYTSIRPENLGFPQDLYQPILL